MITDPDDRMVIASLAMQGLLAGGMPLGQRTAKDAVEQADLLLAALKPKIERTTVAVDPEQFYNDH